MIIYLEQTLNSLIINNIMTNEEVNELIKQGEPKTINGINYLKIIDND